MAIVRPHDTNTPSEHQFTTVSTTKIKIIHRMEQSATDVRE